MNDGKFHDLFEYRKAIISDAGPDSATMRHILLTLSQYMNEYLYCFPSIETLATATALNEKTVRNQLTQAVNQGWIVRETKGSNGQGWKLYEYVGTVPEHTEFNTAASVDNSLIDEELPVLDSDGADFNSKRAELKDQNVRAENPINRLNNNSVNISDNTVHFKNGIDDMLNKNNIEIDEIFDPFITLLVNNGVSNNRDQAKRSVIAWINSKGKDTVYQAYLKTKNISMDYSQNLYGALNSNVK